MHRSSKNRKSPEATRDGESWTISQNIVRLSSIVAVSLLVGEMMPPSWRQYAVIATGFGLMILTNWMRRRRMRSRS